MFAVTASAWCVATHHCDRSLNTSHDQPSEDANSASMIPTPVTPPTIGLVHYARGWIYSIVRLLSRAYLSSNDRYPTIDCPSPNCPSQVPTRYESRVPMAGCHCYPWMMMLSAPPPRARAVLLPIQLLVTNPSPFLLDYTSPARTSFGTLLWGFPFAGPLLRALHAPDYSPLRVRRAAPMTGLL